MAARREMLESKLAYLEEVRNRNEDESEFLEIYDDLAGLDRHRLAAVSGDGNSANALSPDHLERRARPLRDLLRVERKTVIRLRDKDRINHQ